MLELLSSSELIDLMLTTSDETIIIERIFKCSRMPYTDRERKEIVGEIVRRQAHRMLKVYLICLIIGFSKMYIVWNHQGNLIWKQLEKSKVCSGNRTWQSMKEQFRKVLVRTVLIISISNSSLNRSFFTRSRVLVFLARSFSGSEKD